MEKLYYITYDYGYGDRGVSEENLSEDDAIISFNEKIGCQDLAWPTIQECLAYDHPVYELHVGQPDDYERGSYERFMDS